MSGMADRFREERNERERDQAYARGHGYGTGRVQGYSAGCQCHRGYGCAPWTKMGLYTPKMAREASLHLFRAAPSYGYGPVHLRFPTSQSEADALRSEFMAGFRDGLKDRGKEQPVPVGRRRAYTALVA